MSNVVLPHAINRRHFLQLVGGSAVLVALGACTTPSGAGPAAVQNAPSGATTPRRGGVLRIVFADEFGSLDPGISNTFSDASVADMQYERLLRNSDGEPEARFYPVLAKSWETNADATVHTFHLRPGVVFHHGTPFTAKDVEYTINRIMDPSVGANGRAHLRVIDHMEIIDDLTIAFHLAAPDVALPYILSSFVRIVPHDRTTEQLQKEPAGTGPFVMTERVPGQRFVLKRNPNYWDPERPYLDELQVVVIPEFAAQVAALTSGTVDYLWEVGHESLPLLQNAPNVNVLESLQNTYPTFTMSVTQKPFDDVRVRQAMKHVIDRNALHEAMLQGRGAIGKDQPISPGTPFWNDVPGLAYDVAKAKALLAEAGYGAGLAVTLTTTDIAGTRINDAAVVIQEMAKAAGITITLEKVPAGEFYDQKYGQVPFFADQWPSFSDPEATLPLGYTKEGRFNASGWSDPKADELMVAARGELDVAKRKAIYAQVEQIISEQGADIIPYFVPILQAARSNVHGIIPAFRTVYQNIWLE